MKHKQTFVLYTQAAYFVGGLALCGLLVQFFCGNIPSDVFRFPYNAVGGGGFVMVLTVVFVWKANAPLVRRLSSAPFAIVLMIALVAVCVLLGSLAVKADDFWGKLGFHAITSSWYFGLLFVAVLINLWWAILRRLTGGFCFANLVFFANHFGLWLALYAGVLGQGDLRTWYMDLRENALEWRAYDDKHRVFAMPFAFLLNDFRMEVFPNKLYVIDSVGKPLPRAHPQPITCDTAGRGLRKTIAGWQIELGQYLPDAVRMSDSVYIASKMWGCTNAVYVRADNPYTRVHKEGWVSCGNALFPTRVLQLDSAHSVVLAAAEAKQFSSQVVVYQKDTTIQPYKATIHVNHPLRVQGWRVYQSGYDDEAGRWSSLSKLQLVKDPWLPVVYVGLGFLLLGTVGFLFKISKH